MSSSLAGWPFFAVVTAVWGALMVWQVVKLKKVKEDKAKRKAKTLIALVMLLPAVAAFAAIFVVAEKYF